MLRKTDFAAAWAIPAARLRGVLGEVSRKNMTNFPTRGRRDGKFREWEILGNRPGEVAGRARAGAGQEARTGGADRPGHFEFLEKVALRGVASPDRMRAAAFLRMAEMNNGAMSQTNPPLYPQPIPVQ